MIITSDAAKTVTVPQKTSRALIDESFCTDVWLKRPSAMSDLPCADADYAKHDFITDEAGKTYEVRTWVGGSRAYYEMAVAYFIDVDPAHPFAGNTAAFIAWVSANQPQGVFVTIPEEQERQTNPLYINGIPCFIGRADLADCELGFNRDYYDFLGAETVIVAFREVVC